MGGPQVWASGPPCPARAAGATVVSGMDTCGFALVAKAEGPLN